MVLEKFEKQNFDLLLYYINHYEVQYVWGQYNNLQQRGGLAPFSR